MAKLRLTRDNPFAKPGRWFRGAIHFHTSRSDGALTPGEAIGTYRSKGYDFVCIGDHWRVTEAADPEGRIVVIPGCELDTWTEDVPGNLHVMCVGAKHPPEGRRRPGDRRPTHEELWQLANAISDYCFIAHPFWSTRSAGSLKNYPHLRALEVYNGCFDGRCRMGCAEYPWHMLLNEGHRIDALAVDDAHETQEFGRAWVMVKAPACTQTEIVRALKAGDFYSSTGPVIESVTFEGQEVRTSTSPARRILLRSNQFFGAVQEAGKDQPLTAASTPIDLEEMDHVRIEVEDRQGGKAWSNPFYFQGSAG